MFNRKNSTGPFEYDAVLVGAGIMSTTLAVLFCELLPDLKILIIEKLSGPGLESTAAFNNAGTGHAANCELNYTPIDKDGVMDIEKALHINKSFEISLKFWSLLEKAQKIEINKFLKYLPHISFVSGKQNVDFLRRRFELMNKYPEFKDMEFTTSFNQISSWAPLITKLRNKNEEIAATRVLKGTDINFEELTKEYLRYLSQNKNITVKYLTELKDLKKVNDRKWKLYIDNQGKKLTLTTRYVFLGAGGKTINLLQKSKIKEAKVYGGFPVSGKWLICDKAEVIRSHIAKVYGKAEIGSPPMSVPHLDTRWINGKKYLLFGPFAGFTTKFLKNGSNFDLFNSLKKDNILSILSVGFKNIDLINYLISQSKQNHLSRIKELSKMMPSVNPNDWYLKDAGQRVQIIKKTSKGSVLKFGTEIVNSSDGSLSALLGASPGASTSVKIMIDVLKESCFFEKEKDLLEAKIFDQINTRI